MGCGVLTGCVLGALDFGAGFVIVFVVDCVLGCCEDTAGAVVERVVAATGAVTDSVGELVSVVGEVAGTSVRVFSVVFSSVMIEECWERVGALEVLAVSGRSAVASDSGVMALVSVVGVAGVVVGSVGWERRSAVTSAPAATKVAALPAMMVLTAVDDRWRVACAVAFVAAAEALPAVAPNAPSMASQQRGDGCTSMFSNNCFISLSFIGLSFLLTSSSHA